MWANLVEPREAGPGSTSKDPPGPPRPKDAWGEIVCGGGGAGEAGRISSEASDMAVGPVPQSREENARRPYEIDFE